MKNRLIRQTLVFISLWIQLPKPSTQKRCVKALAGKPCEDIYSMLQQSPNSGGRGRGSSQTCSFQRMRFMNRCSNLLIEEQREPDCTGECRNLLDVISKELLKSLFFCDCKENLDCIWFQQRTHRCMNQTLKYKQNCDLQRQSCEKDPGCVELYAHWFQQCQDMFNGYKCTKECLRAEQNLYKHPLGKTLETCECAGSKTQEKFCRSVRMRKAKLCGSLKLTEEDDARYDGEERDINNDHNEDQNSFTFVTVRYSSSGCKRMSGRGNNYALSLFFTVACSLIAVVASGLL